MSTVNDTPGYSPEAVLSPTGTAPQPQRVLACVLCQQRKIRCDPTLATRQRRRRFAERDLLERLRHYESLLRSNEVPFEPLHPSAVNTTSSSDVDKSAEASNSKARSRKPSSAEPKIKTEPVFEAKYAL
ncbi:hypothetical protein MBLNU457_7493t1 [Dothideomycetes sp. NU457]